MLRTYSLLRTVLLLAALPLLSSASISISITIAPPVLPVYVQPECPGQDYIWTPGYWAWGAEGYFWVPGTWVFAPQPGLLWTPGYWGFGAGIYAWNGGYWGPHIGFYGGVNYGFGYGGSGYQGGYWHNNHFAYNTTVNRVNVVNVHNTYNKTVVNNTIINNNRVSYNGPGGVDARPTPDEQVFARERHVQATNLQMAHEHAAGMNRAQFVSANHGRPSNMAVARPLNTASQAAPSPRMVAASRPVPPSHVPGAEAHHGNGQPPHPEHREDHPNGREKPPGEHR